MDKPADALIFGCRDRELLGEVLDIMEDRLAEYDAQFDVDGQELITHAEALKQIFFGKLTRPDCASIYGWAYEVYCASMGDRLDTNPFVPCRGDWYQTLDDFLEKERIPLRFENLIYKCPILLPPRDDWPCVGHWSHHEILAGHQAMARFRRGGYDRSIKDALKVVSEWLNRAVAKPQSLIIGFHG